MALLGWQPGEGGLTGLRLLGQQKHPEPGPCESGP